jgi:lysophospholipase L1-like esterase
VEGSGGFGGTVTRWHHKLTDGPPTRGRRIIVWCLITLAMILVLVSSLTVWVQRQALDTDNWVDLSSELLADEQVRDALAVRLVDSLYAQTEVQQKLSSRLPPALKPLAAPVSGLVREAAVNSAETLLARPRVQQLWANANRRAHETLVRILKQEDTDNLVTSTGGKVILDLNPLVVNLSQQLGLNVSLPEGTGQYVIADSDQLAAAQDAVAVFDALTIFLIIAVVVLLVIAIYLAAGFRREALRGLAVGLIVVGVILLVVTRLVGNALVDELTTDTNRGVGTTVWTLATGLLRDICYALIAYGIVLLIGVWLAGPTRWARWVREKLAPALREHPFLVYGGVALVFLLLLLWSPLVSDRGIWGTLLLAVLVGLGVWALGRQTQKEFPPPPT